jgi:hypothetical protein
LLLVVVLVGEEQEEKGLELEEAVEWCGATKAAAALGLLSCPPHLSRWRVSEGEELLEGRTSTLRNMGSVLQPAAKEEEEEEE